MFKKLSNKVTLVFIFFIILIILGYYSSSKLPVDIFPNLNYPLINVITHYPGGSPKDIEILVTKPIENQLNGLQHIRRVSSVSKQGLSQISVEFDWGTKVSFARQLISQALSVAINELPDGAKPTMENLGSNLQEIIGFGVVSPENKVSLSDLTYLAKTKISNQFKSINGVQRIEVVGGETKAYIISPNRESMIKYKISLGKIKTAVEKNNFQTMAGYIEDAHQDYAVRGLGNIKSIDDLKNTVIKIYNGIPILLTNVAEIKTGALPKRYSVYINGKPGLALSVFKNKNANTVKVAKEIKKKLKRIKKSFPVGVKIVNYYDQSELIEESINNISNNILMGFFLVILILTLLIGKFKNALLIAVTIPAVVLISFIFFPLEHLSMNTITLGAIAVAVGMVVDDSIIVLENIVRHKDMKKSAMQAVIAGTKEIFGADVSGTLTTVVAFLPFVFLPGLAGIFARPFALVIITTLLVSLIISLTIIPLVLLKGKKHKVSKPIAAGFLKSLIGMNQNILKHFLKHKKRVIFLTVIVFFISAGLLVFSRVAFLPQVDEGAILLEYVLTPGTSLNESNRIGEILEQIALQDKDVQNVYRRTGSEGGTYQVEPVNRGELVIKLVSRKKRKHQITDVIASLKKKIDKIPGMIALYHQVTSEKMDESFSGLPTVFGVTLYGEDYSKLIDYAGKIEDIANNTKGIGNVLNNTKYLVPELQYKPDKKMIARYGLNSKDIMKELRLSLGGEKIAEIIKGERNIPIFLRYKDWNNTMSYLKKFPYRVNNNTYIPLSKLLKMSTSYGANAITHINLMREITLPMEVDGSFGAIIKRLNSKISGLHLPKNYFVEFNGQYKIFIGMIKQFGIFALIALLLVYLIMSFQFGNYVQPFVIMLEIPLSFIGAFIAIAISRLPMNLSFFIGLITLVGISVNNGIVLIDYANKKRKEGLSDKESVMFAASVRTRPIILTALTTILGLLPISFGLGIGSKIHQPLAVCVIGGLLVNIILTLNVLPVILISVENLFKKQKSKKK